MRITICDDDILIIEQLKCYIKTFFESKNIECPEITSFHSGESLLADKEDKDILFLDIEMSGINGIYVGKELKKANDRIIIFIVTSYPEYLDEAMRFHVFRYLSKPLDKQRFFRNMKDAVDLYNTITIKVPIETKQGIHTLLASSIIMIEAQGRNVIMVYYIIRYFSPHFFEREENFHFLAIFAIFSKLMFFTVIYIILHFLKGLQNRDEQQDKSVFLLALIPITSVFVMITFTKISDSCDLSPILNWMLTLSAVFLLAINLLIFGIERHNRKKSLEFTEMQLLLQRESDSAQYYEMLLSQHENQSILIHDIKKHLQSISTLNDKMEHDKIKEYIHGLMQSSDLREVSRQCDHEMLNAILARYGHQCLNRHIAFHTDIRSGIIDFIADTDITSLFCNLLDNAIEAAGGIPDSFIESSVCKREKTPFIVITVINSSRKNPFDEQNGKPATTKLNKRKHGFGIKSMRKTVAKYQGDMQMYYNQESLTFHTVITLKQ